MSRNHTPLCDTEEAAAAFARPKRQTEQLGDSERPGAAENRELSPGQAVDRYIVVGLLGEGGMGSVYRAHDPELRREIALKVVRVGEGSGATPRLARSRLIQEAQALAQISHPNVIPVYDAGVAGDEVYVAMELVAGPTLRQWLEGEPTPAEIEATFLAAGRGLAAAHDAGLIHRDFKPDNVMVGDDGRVRVLDFGLAEAIANLKPAAGRAQYVAGTPPYMAPEQFAAEAVDARADQFGFCVALYEAVYGEHPFPASDFEERAARVAEGPAFPGGRVGSDRVRRVLERGLRADPEERYESMEAALADLEPRQSRARWYAATAVLATAAVAAIAVASSRGPAAVCTNARGNLDGVWDDAARARAASAFERHGEDVAPFVAAMDSYTDRWAEAHTQTCRATHVLNSQSDAMLDRRMWCLQGRLAQADAVVEDIAASTDRDSIERGLLSAYELDSLGLCDNLESLARSVPLPESPETRESIRAAEEELARLAAASGDDAVTESDAREVYETARRLGYLPLEADALYAVADARLHSRAIAESPELFREVAQLAASARDDRREARAWLALMRVQGDLGDYEAVITLGPVADAAIRRAGEDAVLRAQRGNHLGWALREVGRYDDARAVYEDALARLADRPQHPTRGAALNGLGVVAKEQGKYREAESHYRAAIEIFEAALGPNHSKTTTARNNLGVTLKVMGKMDEAQAEYERVLGILERKLGPEHPDVALPLANLGSLHLRRGQGAEAAGYFERARALWVDALGADHPNIGKISMDLGMSRAHQGRFEEAVDLIRGGIEIFEKALGANHAHVGQAYIRLGTTHLDAGQPEPALAAAERAIAIVESAGAEPRRMVEAKFLAAKAVRALGPRDRRATKLAKEARQLAAGIVGSENLLALIDEWLAADGR